MALTSNRVISTLQDVLDYIKIYLGGEIPDTTDPEYAEWVKWIQLGQQDAANRGFWRRLLTSTNLTINANVDTVNLPDDFYKINGIHALFVDNDNWNEVNNKAGMRPFVELDKTTGKYRIRFIGKKPTENKTAELWYFFNPPIPQNPTDIILLDGEMIGFYAQKEYFRKIKQVGSMDDARLEYENRLKELLSIEMVPTPQELARLRSYNSYLNKPYDEKNFFI